MIKRLTVIALVVMIILAPTQVFAKSENDAFTFRGYDWGEEMAWVMIGESFSSLEKHKDYDIVADHFMLYDVDVSGYNMLVDFMFLHDSLICGGYFLREDYEKSQDYYDTFSDLLSKYEEKYGEPDSYDREWAPVIKDKKVNKMDSSKYGKYILAGELEITARWTAKDNSRIIMSIYAEDRNISVCALYLEPDYENDTSGI